MLLSVGGEDVLLLKNIFSKTGSHFMTTDSAKKNLLSCSTEEKVTYILDGLKVSKLTANVFFIWLNYPFNQVTRPGPNTRFFDALPVLTSDLQICMMVKWFQMCQSMLWGLESQTCNPKLAGSSLNTSRYPHTPNCSPCAVAKNGCPLLRVCAYVH